MAVDRTNSKFIINRLLEMVTNVALRHSATLRERNAGSAANLGCRVIGCNLDHSDLGTVTMRNDHVIAKLNEIDNGPSGLLDQFKLLSGGIAKGITTKCNYKSLSHNNLTSRLRTSRP